MPNEYTSWAGVAEITDTKLFDKDRKELDPEGTLERYKEIRTYLPKPPTKAGTRYFVAKMPTTSETDTTQDVLRLFVNESWDANFRTALDALEFVKVKDIDHLMATERIALKPVEWTIEDKVELFANLVPGKGRMAKVVFKNKADGELVTAFWCWP